MLLATAQLALSLTAQVVGPHDVLLITRRCWCMVSAQGGPAAFLCGAPTPPLLSGALAPLPMLRYPLASAAAAMRQLAASQHVGKVVCTPPAPARHGRAGRWLVLGGTGALGLLTAQWLASQGADTESKTCASAQMDGSGLYISANAHVTLMSACGP